MKAFSLQLSAFSRRARGPSVGALILLVTMAAMAQERTFALRAGKIFTIANGVIDNGTILVRDGVIRAVAEKMEVPDGVPLWDLPRHFVMPGLLDAETSLTGERSDVEKSLSDRKSVV